MRTYLLVFTAAMVTAVLGTPLVARLARRWGAVDAPDLRKIHKQAIPRIGGLAIVLAMLAGIGAGLVAGNGTAEAMRLALKQLLVLLAVGLLIFAVGLVDDFRPLRARVKLAAQLLAALVLCWAGIRIEQVRVASWFTLDFAWVSWPITVFWIVCITNAVNLIDGLDGLAAGISAVTCGVILILALYSSQVVMAVLMLSLLGALLGFLIFNFNPAKVFMGDCGSMFVGFVLAASSVMCITKSQTLVGLALPALALGVPLFDTFFSILRRLLERRGIMSPDRSHLHHRLLDMGLRHRHVVLFLYGVTLLAAGLGMFMMVTRDTGTLIVFACVVALLVGVFRFLGVVRLRSTIRGLWHNVEIAQKARQDQQGFERAQLHMRQAVSFGDWWRAVCAAAQTMDIAQIRLPLTDRDGSQRPLSWTNPANGGPGGEAIRVTVPVRHRRSGPPLSIAIEVPVDGSVEAAGRRAALFSRLLDEHSIASLPPDNQPVELLPGSLTIPPRPLDRGAPTDPFLPAEARPRSWWRRL